MKERCNRRGNKAYKYYGGRGIKVCEKWSKSFQAFLSDVGERPSPSHTLDRIDNNGDYCLENCQWLTMIEQVAKQGLRCNNTTGVKGIHKHKNGYQISLRGRYIGYSNNLNDAIKILEQYKGE
jgi:hypothetical protein